MKKKKKKPHAVWEQDCSGDITEHSQPGPRARNALASYFSPVLLPIEEKRRSRARISPGHPRSPGSLPGSGDVKPAGFALQRVLYVCSRAHGSVKSSPDCTAFLLLNQSRGGPVATTAHLEMPPLVPATSRTEPVRRPWGLGRESRLQMVKR